MSESIKVEQGDGGSVERSLQTLADKLRGSRVLRPGTVRFRLRGPEGGDYHLETSPGNVELRALDAMAPDRPPILEIFGEAETVRAILAGEQDATEQFFAGGLRVRGDLSYLSDAALELGLIKQPL